MELLRSVGVPIVLWLKVGDVAKQAEIFNSNFNSSATTFIANTTAGSFLEVHKKVQADFRKVQISIQFFPPIFCLSCFYI